MDAVQTNRDENDGQMRILALLENSSYGARNGSRLVSSLVLIPIPQISSIIQTKHLLYLNRSPPFCLVAAQQWKVMKAVKELLNSEVALQRALDVSDPAER